MSSVLAVLAVLAPLFGVSNLSRLVRQISDTTWTCQYEIRCKDLNKLIFGDAGRRDPVGCSNIQFVNRGEQMQCVFFLSSYRELSVVSDSAL